MRLYLVLSLFGLVAAVCLASSQPEEQASVDEQKLTNSEVFVFTNYKNIFKKHYKTFVEELARQKIFLARTFKAFISLVNFKNYKRDFFLKINEMSDWTETELRSLYNRGISEDALSKIPIADHTDEDIFHTPVASMEDIEKNIDEIVEKPEYRDVVKELKKSRSKRDAHEYEEAIVRKVSSRSGLTLNDLLAKPESEPEVLQNIPSTNPDYEPPELTSFGSEESDESENVDNNDFSFIASIPGASYVANVISEASRMVFGDGDEPEYDENKSDYDEVFIDHRLDNCMPKPKRQGKCGSCYIFSVNSLYEWHYCMEMGTVVSFSEQYPLDCGERVGMKGCDGGREYTVADFYGLHGIELSKNYPYRWRSDVCPYDSNASPVRMGYLRLNSYTGLMFGVRYTSLEKFLKMQPILMGVGVPDHFDQYGGGIHDSSYCKEENAHSMLLVGMGKLNGKEYWIFRNSYGPSWGEEGYYRIDKRNDEKCFLFNALGYFLNPNPGEKVFKDTPNRFYDMEPIVQRSLDLRNNIPIKPNPYTSV